jgi:hypothetical protein
MRQADEDAARRLLASCSALLRINERPRGTAFFIAPGWAVTAAHVVDGAEGTNVQLSEATDIWSGHVADARPSSDTVIAGTSPYPAPDVALIRIDEGPAHACALLGQRLPHIRTSVMARGYTETYNLDAVTEETETFKVAGSLATEDPDCTLVKTGPGRGHHGDERSTGARPDDGRGDRDATDQQAARIEPGRLGGTGKRDPHVVARTGQPG